MSESFGLGAILGFSAVQLAIGSCLGWWIHGQRKAVAHADDNKVQELIDQHRRRVEEMDDAMRTLQDLTGSIGENVGQHSSRVQAISEELVTASTAEPQQLQGVLVDAVAKMTEANEQLQCQLLAAEAKLAEQTRALEAQMAQARTDALTGVLNRRAFDEELARRVAEFQRYRTPVALLLCDIDFFKKFNDTHGHQAGDEVLKATAQALAEAMRDVDLVCRYGGEEFAVIMPVTEAGGGSLAAERARAAIECMRPEFGGQAFQVTMSGGVASVLPGEDAASLIRRADEALYVSKKAGRNCSHLHDGKRILPVDGEHESTSGMPIHNQNESSAESCFAMTHDAGPPSESEAADPLHSLPNRDAFTEELRKRIEQNRRFRTPVSLMFCSIDLFAQIGQRHQREIGLLVLRAAVQFLNTAKRETDMVARVAEDRFAMVLPSSSLSKAKETAERVRQAIEKCRVPLADGSPLLFTVSLGLTEVQTADDTNTVIERASVAVDSARLAGGNCIRSQEAQDTASAASSDEAAGVVIGG